MFCFSEYKLTWYYQVKKLQRKGITAQVFLDQKLQLDVVAQS